MSPTATTTANGYLNGYTNGHTNGYTNGHANGHAKDDLNLSILGIGVEYPPFRVGPEDLETVASRHYPDSIALKKVLAINRMTGIDTRASVGDPDNPIVNGPTAPSILELNDYFQEEGVRLSVNACQKSLAESGVDVGEITHVISTTCTNSANPGFDQFVIKKLGIRPGVEKVLLHGVGCSGGLAAIRTASNLALGKSFQKKPARILVIACEISTLLIRSELDSIDKDQTTRIGVCLFSDCASSVVISNGIGHETRSESIFDILGWKHDVLEDTAHDLGFDVDPLGWKVVLSPRVPQLSAAAVPPAYDSLIDSLPQYRHKAPTDFDWALHPGGSTIITGVQSAMKLTEMHLRATYEIYMKYGNSSSATVISVMNKLRETEGREDVMACAFGPGISLEMMALKRHSKLEEQMPQEGLD